MHVGCLRHEFVLTLKGRSSYFSPFLKFAHAIVYAIFVQKIPNFWQTCGLVLDSRPINFYKIPISFLGVMPQKYNSCELTAARGAKNFLFLTFLGWIFFIDSLKSS
jgi:hypothetical protein